MTQYEHYQLVLTVIQTTAIILGFFIAYKQLLRLRKDSYNSLEIVSQKHAMDLIARYSEPSFLDHRIKLRASPRMKKDHYECAYLLNFFEEMAISIKHKIANQSLLEDFFRTILNQWLEEQYMVDTIVFFRKKDREVFQNLLELYRNWEGKRDATLKIDTIPELK
jgi:hypothetical protein